MSENEILKKLEDLDKRLSKIENKLNIVSPSETVVITAPVSNTPNPSNPFIKANKNYAVNVDPLSKTSEQPIKKNYNLPYFASGSAAWLGILAVICFVIAGSYIIKMAIDSGWFTPYRRLGAGIVFGFTLIGAGHYFYERDKNFASLLPAAGIIILYLCTYSAVLWLHIISPFGGLAIVYIVSLLCVWLFVKFQHETYPVVAAVGSYIAPLIMGISPKHDLLFTYLYILLCSLTYAIISTNIKSRTLSIISTYLAILITMAVSQHTPDISLSGENIKSLIVKQNNIASIKANLEYQNLYILAWFLAINFLINSASVLFYTVKSKTPLEKDEAWAYFPILLLFYAFEYDILNKITPNYAPWFSLLFAAALYGLYVIAKRSNYDTQGSKPALITFLTIVLFHSLYLQILPDILKPWLFVIAMVGISSYDYIFKQKDTNKTKNIMFLPILVIKIIVIVEYIRMVACLMTHQMEYMLVTLISIISIWYTIFKFQARAERAESLRQALLLAAHFITMCAIATMLITSNSFTVSFFWLLYSTVVMYFANVRKDTLMAKSTLLVLVISTGKALLIDTESSMAIVRIACLILTGAVLFGSGMFLRKIDQWKQL